MNSVQGCALGYEADCGLSCPGSHLVFSSNASAACDYEVGRIAFQMVLCDNIGEAVSRCSGEQARISRTRPCCLIGHCARHHYQISRSISKALNIRKKKKLKPGLDSSSTSLCS
ncbi:hypothetical protein EVAR_15108_1 [Eumeta japonica]|uniref:Uncharacterized protein n=1 Tax=Eumeta variegata TaxID=151549 RepID=A0A4C1UI44_EUMVA|nr:hypothetical protein EVAR_15108_1 [Eumeta japonica]